MNTLEALNKSVEYLEFYKDHIPGAGVVTETCTYHCCCVMNKFKVPDAVQRAFIDNNDGAGWVHDKWSPSNQEKRIQAMKKFILEYKELNQAIYT